MLKLSNFLIGITSQLNNKIFVNIHAKFIKIIFHQKCLLYQCLLSRSKFNTSVRNQYEWRNNIWHDFPLFTLYLRVRRSLLNYSRLHGLMWKSFELKGNVFEGWKGSDFRSLVTRNNANEMHNINRTSWRISYK